MEIWSIFVILIREFNGLFPAGLQNLLSDKGSLNRRTWCIWWNFEQMVMLWMLTFMANNCSEYMLLWKLTICIFVKWICALLQNDNALPQTTHVTKRKLELEQLRQPAQSPNLASSDYHIFQAIALFPSG